MKSGEIDTAMVLAAGLGVRMRPITLTRPKPLVRVAGRPLIDYAFEALTQAGVKRAVVNVHHLADQIADHVAALDGLAVSLSDERDRLLDSGGGVAKALPLLGEKPFIVLNADTFWLEERRAGRSNLAWMIERFDPETMDILMLVVPLRQTTGHDGAGDFTLDVEGRLIRYDGRSSDPLVYAGALVVHPRIFADAPKGPFSLNRLFDAALAADRMHAVTLRGHWLTVGTPAAIGAAEAAMARFDEDAKRTA